MTSAMLDSTGFVDAVEALPEQVAAAVATAADADLTPVANVTHRSIIVLGMGGSGIAGDMLTAVAGPACPLPIGVSKNYSVPGYVDESTLVIASSYSGDTEETVSAAAEAVDRGAKLVAVTTGGALGALAEASGGVVVPCPEGLFPRAAVGALSVPAFLVLEKLGYCDGASNWIRAAQVQLASRRDTLARSADPRKNEARQLARRIGRTFPLVYGGDQLGAVAALRWKADINENAKAPAFWNTFPELDHNEIMGWGQHGDVTRQVISLVELRHDFEHLRTARRITLTREIIRETVAQVLPVKAAGDGPLAQLLDLMYVGDWVSVYMAADAQVDPGPIDAIARLKHQLAKES